MAMATQDIASTGGLRSLARTNLAEEAHRELARGLSSGRFLPGARLGIRELAEEMGISPTPIREALQQLVAEGAFTQIAGRSFRVPVLGAQDYLELRRLRVMLEGDAAAEAALRITPAAIAELEALHDQLARARAVEDYKTALSYNQQFHLRICAESGNQRLLRIVEGLWLQMGPLLNVLYPRIRTPGDATGAHPHVQVTQALHRRDPEAARRALQDDIMGGAEDILAALRARDTDPPGPRD